MPVDNMSPLKDELFDWRRVTVIVYVEVVVPSWAVTTIRMMLGPTASAPVNAVVPVDPRY